MSEVVLRCPNCGTTQGAAGECEACHESDVRFFCTNHAPGRWLDGPACAACGARHGVERAPPRPAPPRRPEPRRPEPRRPEPRRPEPRRPAPAAPPPAPWGEAPPRPASTLPPFTLPPAPPRRARERAEPPLPRDELSAPPGLGLPRVRVPVVGCLVRLFLVLVLLAVLAVAAIVALFGGVGAVREWAVDVGQSTGVLEGVPDQTRRGIAAYEAGNRAAAERELRSAARLYPRSALALVYLARMSDEDGRPARAAEYLRAAAAREPGSPAVHRELGAHHLAAARAAAANGAGPDDAGAELAEAERRYALALRLDPGDAAALGGYGCVLALAGRVEEGAAAVARAGRGRWEACLREAPLVP